MNIEVDKTLALPQDQYIRERMSKNLIVLHFTAGTSVLGAVTAWRFKADRIGTAFVVGTDGKVFQIFEPEFWAYHLGVKGGGANERRSIGIEIVNVGPLRLRDGELYWWPKDWQERYNGPALELPEPWRGERHFATFPLEQVFAVRSLCRELCSQFGIPFRVVEPGARLEASDSFSSFTGIATHCNFRKDKWDIGPAWQWEKFLEE